MAAPTYAQLVSLGQPGPGYNAESIEERLLTIFAMLASGTSPDGTPLPAGGGGGASAPLTLQSPAGNQVTLTLKGAAAGQTVPQLSVTDQNNNAMFWVDQIGEAVINCSPAAAAALCFLDVGAIKWEQYMSTGVSSLFISDMVNARFQVQYIPGATAATAVTNIFSALNVNGQNVAPSILGQAAGDWIQPPGTIAGTYLGANNTMYFTPIYIQPGRSIANFSTNVQTAGAAGATLRFGIYADNNGVPGTLIADAGTVVTTATGTVSIAGGSPAALLTGGIFHIACCPQGTPATQATFFQSTGDAHTKYPTTASNVVNAQDIGIVSGVSAALPNPGIATRNVSPFGQMPAIAVQLS